MSVSEQTDQPEATPTRDNAIAIIGLAGRFPGARSIAQFWANVRDGVESIRVLSTEELLAAGVSQSDLSNPDYVRACPVLEDVDKFDARFFGFSPRDASVMDPAHRFFLEVVWEAVEHAGYTALPEEGAVGVFAGSGAALYMMENLRTNPELMRSMGEFLVRHTGNDMNFLATRVSYEMDLRGPSINVQTACSSALVALHMACQSLLSGECTLAIAGGSTVLIPNAQGYHYKEGEILSPDGHCRPFDAKSAGTVFGSGSGCVVLKRLQDALDDGDTIHAVVKGSAINNDGALKVGYLAPGVDGQAAVIERALSVADVPADSISYIETHGTGTSVGDPIEVEALNKAFQAHTKRRKFCAIGSVKSNIGHLGEAAAAASLIKAIMALKHRQLPPSLGYDAPNPAIDFETSPFFVNDRLRPWLSDGPLRCGITALGAGGTNCHVILEEAPERIAGEGARARQLLLLSAKTRSALDAASERLAQAIESDPSLDLADAAFTLALGRRAMPHRRAVAVADRADAIACLRERDPKRVVSLNVEAREPAVVFMFPGGGAQYARMGMDLYESEDAYRDSVDACLELIEPELGRDLRSLMFASEADAAAATRTLEQPSLTLPSLFTAEYALAKQFESWGLSATAFVGHSMGEYVAACLSGVVTLRDALRLVMLRGRLFEQVESGAMLSVPLSEAALHKLMPRELSIAAVNAPELSVASGPIAAIERLQATLAARDIECTRIRIDVAAHSSMLDPILEQFRKLCRTIQFQAPQIPFVSNLSGSWITPAQATDPEYWVKHLRSTVRFADCIESVLASGERVLLEVGPGRTLSMLARAQAKPARHAFNSMRHPQESASDLEYALTSLGRVWSAGCGVDWDAFYAGQLRNRVPLPSYPFEQQSFWVEPGRAPRGDTRSGELGKRSDLSQWFYGLTWAQVPLLESVQPSAGPQRWLIVAHDRPEGEELGRLLERTGDEVIGLVTPGEQLARHNTTSKEWWLDFRAPEQLTELVRELDDKGYRFDHVVYLTGSRRRLPKLGRLKQLAQQQALTADFYGLTYLARALGSLAEPMRLSIVTTDLADVAGQHIDPLRSVVLGPTYVTPREFPQLQTRCIDMPSGIAVALQRPKLMQSLLQELRADSDERLIALRGSGRWVRRVLPQPLPKLPETTGRAWLRPAGVYLVTGGLGGIGLEVAAHLARQERVTLLLNARQGLPPESQWDSILAKSDPASRRAQRIAKVRELRALGADVRIVAADVTDLESMRAALARVRAEVGPLTGVFHAAGLMDDEPMQSKTQASMQRVLAPKLQGSMNLDELIHEPLDFFVLFSSVASFLGLPGQVDYTAANAFLDAFAQERSRRARGRTLVINWNAWREVGMAEAARAGQTAGAEPTTPCAHPALDGYSDEPTGRVFVTDFSLARHWLLSEHRIKGSYALLPGTAFVELARAAFGSGGNGFGVELTNLTFLSPFQVAEGETRRMSIYLVPAGGGQEISMHSGMDPHSAPHVVGEVRAFAGPTPGTLDLSALRLRCNVREECPKDRLLAQDFVAFGARWANIVRVMYGHSEALLELELAPQFAEDLSAYGLHPALLDMATGGAQQLIPGVDLNSDFYVPMRYERIRIVAPMPRRVFSHVRCLAESGAGLAYFDVILCDERGRVFAEITRFTMKRLDAKSAMTAAAQNLGPRPDQRRNEAMDVLLREAISPAEGVDALDRIMAQPALVQSVASSVDVLDWQAQLAAVAKPVTTGDAEEAPSGFSRPNLATEFEAPSSATEHALAAIWSELVGVQQIGVLDDFFDLGGNSLVAVRLFAAIKKHFRVALPLSTLFEAPTIRQLAALLEASGAIASEATAVAQSAGAVSSQAEATDAMVHAFEPSFSSSGGYTPLVPIQIGSGVPFFCVHGAGGNVLNFRDLAKRLTASQSFYGLQAKGVTGGEPAGSIEEMASTYIAAIRGLRPRGPFLLGGYSGGGVVAYEMAQRLRAAGERVNLVLLDTFHPATGARAPSRNERFEYLVAEGTPYFSRTGKAKLVRMLQGFASDARIRYHQRLGAPLPLELREMHITRAFDQAASRYVTKRYDGPVTLYKARNVNRFFEHVGPTLGWAEFIPELEVVHVPGDHTNLMIEPNVQTLINHLKQLLAAAAREEPAQDTATPRLENTEVAAQ
jgi:acyl transferase domain-containing protein/thioesterase domain-containing protein/acyl carrier protein